MLTKNSAWPISTPYMLGNHDDVCDDDVVKTNIAGLKETTM